jgi:hypothetical protein
LCMSYLVGSVGGYEQEVLSDPQASSSEETNPGSEQSMP